MHEDSGASTWRTAFTVRACCVWSPDTRRASSAVRPPAGGWAAILPRRRGAAGRVATPYGGRIEARLRRIVLVSIRSPWANYSTGAGQDHFSCQFWTAKALRFFASSTAKKRRLRRSISVAIIIVISVGSRGASTKMTIKTTTQRQRSRSANESWRPKRGSVSPLRA